MDNSGKDQMCSHRPRTRVRVGLVEDDVAQHEALRGLLGADPGIEVAAHDFSAETALDRFAKLSLDVALVDLGLPGMSGIDLIRHLKPKAPATQFLVLTAFDGPDKVFAALSVGATGYLLKSEPPERITQAVLDIARGEAPMSGAIARQVIACFANQQTPTAADAILSSRENEILELLARGLLYKEIAEATRIGLGTVRTHIRRIYEKLHVHNRTGAISKLAKVPFRPAVKTEFGRRSRNGRSATGLRPNGAPVGSVDEQLRPGAKGQGSGPLAALRRVTGLGMAFGKPNRAPREIATI